MLSDLGLSMFSADFMPHGNCYLWQPGLLWLHVVSDALIVVSYFSIPFALFALIRRRDDLHFDWILRLFGLFILLCGATHLLAIWTTWVPMYWLSGIVKAITALVSVLTAVLVWPLLPRLVALPSAKQLLAINQELGEVLDLHRTAERELRKLSLAMEYTSSMVIITDTQGVIEYCNPAFCQGTGYEERELLGNKVSLLGSGFTDPAIYRDLWETISRGESWQGELLDRKKNGDLYWSMLYIAPVKAEGAEVTHYVAVSHDISDLKNSEETIRRLAFYDPLTELPNRALFKERLEQALLRSRRDDLKFALMYIDLDHFKRINDSLGHVVGDKLLIEAARRLQRQLRGTDTVARMGGDEFAVIVGDLRATHRATEIAKSLCLAVSAPYRIEGHELTVSTSIGISLYPDDHTEIERLIRQADQALYAAKDAGRNQFAYYAGISDPLRLERLTMEADLRHAVEHGDLGVEYLPQVDLADGRLVGVEARPCWRHPRHGPIPHESFITLAEEIGLAPNLGGWLLRSALGHIQPWRRTGFAGPVVFKLSPRQFRDNRLLALVDAITQDHGIDAQDIAFEIGEASAMEGGAHTTANLQGMRARGLRVSIAGFGTGYSSLGHLPSLPVDALKIDRSLVQAIGTEPGDKAVKAIIALARSLGLAVAAEGVETQTQLEFLRRAGCDRAQGDYLSPPLVADELQARIPDWDERATALA